MSYIFIAKNQPSPKTVQVKLGKNPQNFRARFPWIDMMRMIICKIGFINDSDTIKWLGDKAVSCMNCYVTIFGTSSLAWD